MIGTHLAHIFQNMIAVHFFLFFCANLFGIRTCVELFGSGFSFQKSKVKLFIPLFMFFLCFLVVRNAVILFFAIAMQLASAACFVKMKGKRDGLGDVENWIDGILMCMRAGNSFESAAAEACRDNLAWKKWFLLSENARNVKKDVTNGQTEKKYEILKILCFCRKNSSQSYKILTYYRDSERLRSRLHRKQGALTLQAKAQALVSCALYLIVLLSQWALNPDFLKFMATVRGRTILTGSFFLVAFGATRVFKMAVPRGLEI